MLSCPRSEQNRFREQGGCWISQIRDVNVYGICVTQYPKKNCSWLILGGISMDFSGNPWNFYGFFGDSWEFLWSFWGTPGISMDFWRSLFFFPHVSSSPQFQATVWHFQWLGHMNWSQEPRPLNAYKRMFGCLHAWLCLHNPGQAMACLWLGLKTFPYIFLQHRSSHKWQSPNATVEEILQLKFLKPWYIVGINQLVSRISFINRVNEDCCRLEDFQFGQQIWRITVCPCSMDVEGHHVAKNLFPSNCVTHKYLMVYTLWN